MSFSTLTGIFGTNKQTTREEKIREVKNKDMKNMYWDNKEDPTLDANKKKSKFLETKLQSTAPRKWNQR